MRLINSTTLVIVQFQFHKQSYLSLESKKLILDQYEVNILSQPVYLTQFVILVANYR